MSTIFGRAKRKYEEYDEKINEKPNDPGFTPQPRQPFLEEIIFLKYTQ
jgi:hypothetical protein